MTGLAALIKAQRPQSDWRGLKNLILSSGDSGSVLAARTVTGKRINAFTALTCQDSRVFSIVQYPAAPQIGVPATLSALSINCDASAGPVTATLSGGEVVMLKDDGIAPDQAAGDGIYSASFTPTRTFESYSFSSPAGSESIGTVTAPAPLAITTSTMPNATAGIVYSQTLAASGGTMPYSWSVTGGILPPGLVLASGGVVNGTPAAAGAFNFTVAVADANGARITRGLSITVASAPAPVFPVVIATRYIPAGSVGSAYNTYLGASGGSAPYRWSISSGTLPAGLALNETTGQISGVPSASGNYSCAIRATDAKGAFVTKTFSVSIANYAIASGRVGYSYSYQLNASGGTPPYSWTLTGGALPPGLRLATGGLVSGVPTTAGSYVFNARVTDSRGLSGNSSILINVN